MSKTDQELLELAAKTAGAEINGYRGKTPLYAIAKEVAPGEYEYTPWNPLTDDGDALRLAVKCRLDLTLYSNVKGAFCRGQQFAEENPTDPYAATRRAIVRAAAAIAEREQRG